MKGYKMQTTKEILMARGEQAIKDRKILDGANLLEVEQMPMWYTFEALRFLQRLCNQKNISIQDVTPELILDSLN